MNKTFVAFAKNTILMLNFVLLATLVEDPEAEIKSLTATYVQATLDFDLKTFDQIFHADYMEVSPVGTVDNRAQIIKSYDYPPEKRPPAPSSFALSEWLIKFPTPEIATLTYKQVYTLTRNGQSTELPLRISATWIKTDAGWKMLLQQLTPIRSRT